MIPTAPDVFVPPPGPGLSVMDDPLRMHWHSARLCAYNRTSASTACGSSFSRLDERNASQNGLCRHDVTRLTGYDVADGLSPSHLAFGEGCWHSHHYGAVPGSFNGEPLLPVRSQDADPVDNESREQALGPLVITRVPTPRVSARRNRNRRRMLGYVGAMVLLAGARFNQQVRQRPRTWW